MPTDCFISVRVGEMQKMSKLSSSRIFRFPQAEKGKHGKIEVFKRIGYATVDIDPKLGEVHDVSVDCAKSGFGKLDLRIGVESKAAKKSCGKSCENQVARPSETMSLEKEKLQGKMRLAQEYLSQHRIEMHLADAMQSVLRERPDNPNEFIAHKLVAACAANPKLPSQDKVQENAVQSQKTNHSACKKDSCDVPAVQDMQAIRYGKLELCSMKSQAVASDDTTLAQASSENCNGGHPRDQGAGLVERRFEHLPSVGTWRCVRLPAQARAAENCNALAADLAAVDCRDRFRSMPSVGTWCMSRFHATPLQMQKQMKMPTKTQLQVNKGKQEQQQQLLQKSLRNHHRRLPSVGTWMLPRETKALAVQSDEHRVIRRFCDMPSVGTWLAPRFQRPASLKITEDRTTPIFCHTPSVGTWYAARISRVGVVKERCDTKVETLSVNDTALVRASPLSCTRSFRNMPSVVTWMTRRPISTAVVKRTCRDVKIDVFHCLPSVGTWYAPRRPKLCMTDSLAHITDIEIASNEDAKLRCFQHMPSVSTWLAPRVPRANIVESRMKVVSKIVKTSCDDVDICRFRYMPSVCTWLAPRVRRPAVVDERILVDVASRSFCHLASVGTWLAPRVWKTTAISSSLREDIEVCSVEKASCNNVELRRFPLLPSVGTWLAPRGTKPVIIGKRTSQDAEIPEFRRLPSVCTWLAPRRPIAVVVEVNRPKPGQ
eukprot:TRINITY_DN30467_c0_g1_i1.p1 TRINITY_DN30467_c0_g1~~TRINITY_DN30467_c0_g1_i1.p1  ORF type:complete len:754 (-),score=120.30 TRINITY_DN30467_c0_g1_i1:226-2367(-)